MLGTVVTLVAAVPLSLVLLEYLYLRKWGDFHKLPGPKRLPLLGTTWLIPRDKAEIDEFSLKQTHDYGSTRYGAFRTWLGMFPVLETGSPEVVQRIISTPKNNSKGIFYKWLYPWLGRGLLTSEGELWHARRHLLTPAFHFSILNGFAEVMNEQASILVEQLSSHADTGEPVGVFHYITLCALDIIMETAMGATLGSQTTKKEPEYVTAIYSMSTQLVERVLKPWLLVDQLFALSSEAVKERMTLEILHSFTDKVIKERRQNIHMDEDLPQKRRKAFLDLILTAKLPDGSMLSDREIREEVDTFMFEGHDTTSAAVAWCLHLIASHPDVQRKVQDELDEVLDDSDSISSDQLGKLKYLEMVSKEALRLKPSVPGILRTLSEPIQLDDLTIPAGVAVNIRIWAMHRDPLYWENPLVFDPERWTTERSKNYHPYQYIPFSAGPRNCIGQKFAQLEEKIVLAKVLKNFRVECDVAKVDSIPELILRPRPEVPLRLYRR